jgi:hypothetical protein
LYNASLSLVDVHIVRTGGSNYWYLTYGGSKRGGGFEIACAHFPSEIADHRDAKLCTMIIIISRYAYCQDRRIQYFFFELGWMRDGWRI